jgi:large subunit ribosomal protein L21
MSDFAIIETGGKQYKVTSGMKMKVEKLDATGGAFSFDKVLLRSTGGKLEIGAPHIAGAKIAASVVRDGRARKVIVFRYHSKTRYRKKKGHRQEFTEVVIQ